METGAGADNSTRSLRGAFFDRFVGEAELSAIPWAVAGRHDFDPRESSLSDIDLLLTPEDLPHGERALLKAADHTKLRVFRRIRREYGVQLFLAGWSDLGEEIFHVDLLPVTDYRGADYRFVSSLLANRIEADGVFRLSPADEATYLLLRHLLWGGVLKHPERLREIADQVEEQLREALEMAVGSALAAEALMAILDGEEQKLLRLAGPMRRYVMRRAIHRRPMETVRRFAGTWLGELGFLLRPAGLSLLVKEGPGRAEAERGLMNLLADDRLFWRRESKVVSEAIPLTRPGEIAGLLRRLRYGLLLWREDALKLSPPMRPTPLFPSGYLFCEDASWYLGLGGRRIPLPRDSGQTARTKEVEFRQEVVDHLASLCREGTVENRR